MTCCVAFWHRAAAIVPLLAAIDYYAKDITYLKGFAQGIIIVGEFKGRKVQEARPLIRRKLLETGESSTSLAFL